MHGIERIDFGPCPGELTVVVVEFAVASCTSSALARPLLVFFGSGRVNHGRAAQPVWMGKWKGQANWCTVRSCLVVVHLAGRVLKALKLRAGAARTALNWEITGGPDTERNGTWTTFLRFSPFHQPPALQVPAFKVAGCSSFIPSSCCLRHLPNSNWHSHPFDSARLVDHEGPPFPAVLAPMCGIGMGLYRNSVHTDPAWAWTARCLEESLERGSQRYENKSRSRPWYLSSTTSVSPAFEMMSTGMLSAHSTLIHWRRQWPTITTRKTCRHDTCS